MEHQRYKIINRLDAGGMAEVFRGIAESTVGGLKRNVAIKRILPSLTKNKKFVAMFLDEARLALHLQHANIVQVFDIGVAELGGVAGEAAYFLVMEYVDGMNLKVLFESLKAQGQRMAVSQILYLMMEVCKALGYAHDMVDPETGRPLGIVHRDISPPNILLSKRGEIKLADFGLAKAASQLENTDPGVVKGKFSYLSPEAAGAQEVDRRADIFAVGILLYEMLTGKRLFDGETDYQTVELVRQAHVPPIASQNPEVTSELESIVRKALARDPERRYQRADDLLDALAQYLFSRSLKVTSRDIENLVGRCLAERQRNKPEKISNSLIDTLIQDEILRFTSLEELGDDSSQKPPETGGMAPLNPELFIDPRKWNADSEPSEPPRVTRSGEKGGRPLLTSNPSLQSLEAILEGAAANTTVMPVPKRQKDSSRNQILIAVTVVLAVLAVLAFYLLQSH